MSKMSNWVIPCNPKYYNHKDAFQNCDYIDWRQSTNVEIGDFVYIYVGKPSSSLMYKCKAIDVNMTNCDNNDREYNLTSDLVEKKHNRWMRLVLVEKYEEGRFEKEDLLENGLGTIQGPCRVLSDFDEYISMNK